MPTVDEARITITGDVTGVSTALGETEAKAEKTATAVGTGFSSEFNKASGAGAAFAGALGGPFAKIGSLANSALKPILELGTGVGGLAGGLTALGGVAAFGLGAVAAVGFGLRDMAEAAGAADDRLVKLGLQVAGGDPGIREYRGATKDLGIAFDELTDAVGGPVAEDLTKVAAAAAYGVRSFTDAYEKLQPYVEELQFFARVIGDVTSLGLLELARATLDFGAAANQAEVDQKNLTEAEEADLQAKQDEKDAQQAMVIGAYQQANADRESTAALKERTAAEKAAKAQHDLVMSARIAHWQDDAEAEQAASDQEDADAAATRARMLADNQAIVDGSQEILDTRVADDDAATANAKKNAGQLAQIFGGAALQMLSSLQQVDQATISSFQARVSSGKHVSDQEILQARAAHDRIEAESIIQAGVQATLSGLGMITALSPIMGLAAIPVGITIAAGLFGAATAAIVAGSPFNYSYNNESGGHTKAGEFAAGDTDGDGQPDDNSKPKIPGTNGDSGRQSRGSHVSVGVDRRTRRLSFRVEPFGKRAVVR